MHPLTVHPWPQILAGIVGLFAGAVIVFAGPRLAADRLSERPPYPGFLVLLPLVGGGLGSYRPWRTLFVECVTAILLIALSLHYAPDARLMLGCAYTILLMAIGYIDVDYRLVLNKLSYPGIVVALGASLLWPGLNLRDSILGAVSSFLIFAFLQILGRGALGTGDTKLAILIGAMRGLPAALDGLLVGVVFGAVAALIALLVLRRGRKSFIAYAPYLAAGAYVSFFVTPP